MRSIIRRMNSQVPQNWQASRHAPRSLLWRAWRSLALPLSYPIFAIGSLVLLSLVPCAVLCFRDRRERTVWLRAALHNGARLWVKLAEALQILDVAETDLRPARPQSNTARPLLVIANHPSLIDVLLINAALPNLCCVLKGNLHYNPLFTVLIRCLDYLPNSDPEYLLNEGAARLAAGENLLIFPEGTRSEPGEPLDFKLGAAELALRSGCAVLPVTIHCASRYLSKRHPWYRLPADKLRYHLVIGPEQPGQAPIAATESRSRRRAARRELNNRWRDHFTNQLVTGPAIPHAAPAPAGAALRRHTDSVGN